MPEPCFHCGAPLWDERGELICQPCDQPQHECTCHLDEVPHINPKNGWDNKAHERVLEHFKPEPIHVGWGHLTSKKQVELLRLPRQREDLDLAPPGNPCAYCTKPLPRDWEFPTINHCRCIHWDP